MLLCISEFLCSSVYLNILWLKFLFLNVSMYLLIGYEFLYAALTLFWTVSFSSIIFMKNSRSRTSKYLIKLTPDKIHEVRKNIKRPQRLCSGSCNRRCRLVEAVLKYHTKRNQRNTREKNLLHNVLQNKRKNGYSLSDSHLCSTIN